MTSFEGLLVVLLVAVLLAALARRVGAPYPAFLAIGGAALAFVPGLTLFELDPDLALAIFVAPVLLDAAYDASPRDLKANWAPLAGLAVVAVIVTTAAVAWVAHALVPAMPWAAAVALGAIVAPPDAAAAMAVLRQLRPPHRILTILEGESLLNDATALLIYRLAVGAVLAGTFNVRDVAPAFLLAVAGSLIAGPVLAWSFSWLMRDVRDTPTFIILGFISTFGVWILAERIGLSAVLTMVCYAVVIARRAPARTPARMRVPAYAVWETVVFVVNVLAFVFIGLQVRPILAALDAATRVHYVLVGAAVLLTVIVVRLAWVMSYTTMTRWVVTRRAKTGGKDRLLASKARAGLVVSWCGMRGIVTLAGALALPLHAGGVAFPARNLIVLTAFLVVLGTLVIQGLTLAPLLRALALPDDDPVGREVALARSRALRAALDTIDGDRSTAADAIRNEFEARLDTVGTSARTSPAETPHDRVRRSAVAAARRTILDLRQSAEIGDDAFHVVEEELDWIEMSGTRN